MEENDDVPMATFCVCFVLFVFKENVFTETNVRGPYLPSMSVADADGRLVQALKAECR